MKRECDAALTATVSARRRWRNPFTLRSDGSIVDARRSLAGSFRVAFSLWLGDCPIDWPAELWPSLRSRISSLHQKVPTDRVEMRKHRLFGRLRITAQQGLNNRRVLIAICRSPLGGEGAPLDPKPLFLLPDEPQNRVH